MDQVTIDGQVFRRVDDKGQRLCLVCVDNRGLTFVGKVTWDDDDYDHGLIRIRDARCVIRWGTDQHIAQLASDGPRADTLLGAKRDVFVAGVVFVYECNEDAWKDV